MVPVKDICVDRDPAFTATRFFEIKEGFKYFLANTNMLSRQIGTLVEKPVIVRSGLYKVSL